MDLLDYLRHASETAKREHPERLTVRDLATIWADYEQGVYREYYVPDVFAELMRLREMVQAFGAGAFDLEGARALYDEGQRLLDEELAEAGVEVRR